MRFKNSKLAVLVVISTAALTAAGSTIALALSPSSAPQSAQLPSVVVPNIFGATSSGQPAEASGSPLQPSTIASLYPVFSAAAAASPPASQAYGGVAEALSVDAAQSRTLGRGPDSEVFFAAPAKNAVCVASSDALIQACSPYPIKTPNEIVGSTSLCSPSGDLEFAAMLPDNPATVTVHYSDGSTSSASTSDGLVILTAGRSEPLPLSISWSSGNTTLTADTGVPAGASPSFCTPSA
jgi:hypothetical protein